MKQYLEAYKTKHNVFALWEEQKDASATIICNADGSPAKAMYVRNLGKNFKQALIPVKKNQFVLQGSFVDGNEEIHVYRILYPFTNKSQKNLVKVSLVCSCKNGVWDKEPPTYLSTMFQILRAKVLGYTQDVVASSPLTLSAKCISGKRAATLDETCGASDSTIICTAGGGRIVAEYFYPKKGTATGKQACVCVFPLYKVLRGCQTSEGPEISIYSVLRTLSDKDGAQLEVKLVNHLSRGIWAQTVPMGLRAAVRLLIAKINETDTQTTYAKSR